MRVYGIQRAQPGAMLDVVLCLAAIVAGGLVVELFAAARAPMGYEDEHGFHLGIPRQGPDISVLSSPRHKAAPRREAVPALRGQLVTT